jgi:hypothetical protein
LLFLILQDLFSELGKKKETIDDEGSVCTHSTQSTRRSNSTRSITTNSSIDNSVGEVEIGNPHIDAVPVDTPVHAQVQETEGVDEGSTPTDNEEIELCHNGIWQKSAKSVLNMNKKERMIELIKRVCGKRIDKVYGNKPLFYLFLKTCAMNVVFKTKWNANSTIKNYYEYVTVQDEAFAFLVLENNGNRYLDMLNTKKKRFVSS